MFKKYFSFLVRKIRNGSERSVNAKKNILASFLIKGGSILTSLALIPLTIDFVSSQQYGVWLTLSSIIAWFSFFDIGFGNGLRNKFAEAVALNNTKLAKIYVSTTYAVLSIIVVFIWILFFLVNSHIAWSKILNVDISLLDELRKVTFITFTFFSLQFVLKLIGTVLTASQQPAKSSVINLIADISSLLIIFILTKFHYQGSLNTLAFITGATLTLSFFVFSIYYFTHQLKQYAPNMKYVQFKYLPDLMGLGVKFFFIQITAVLIFQCTNIIITQILGPEYVTVYNVVYRYFSIPVMVTAIVCAPLWSAYTDAYTKKDYEWMKSVQKKLSRLWLYSLGLLIVMLSISQIVFKLWVGSRVSIPIIVSVFMMLNIMAYTGSSIFLTIIGGIGKIRVTLIINITLSILFVPMAILLGRKFGLVGIVFANFLVNVIYATIAPIQSKKIISQTAEGIWNK